LLSSAVLFLFFLFFLVGRSAVNLAALSMVSLECEQNLVYL